ncbi:MAG: ABC transporter permease [Oscillospiraceae bacterium]|jgi:oligopeptide transport system permease protein|nr:ABC transporter permease [Oscillospiraceae bacterium]
MAKLKLPLPSLHASAETVESLIGLGTLTADDFALSTAAEKESFLPAQKSMGYWQDAWRRLKKNRVSMVSLCVIVVLMVFAFAGPVVLPYKYQEQLRTSLNLAPMKYSASEQARMAAGEKIFPHVFGTDTFGRDILARVMIGTRVSVTIGLLAALLVLIIGSVYGAISGFIGGIVDSVMMRIVDIIASIPDVLVVLLLSVTLKPRINDLVNAVFANAGASPHGFVRILQVLGSSVIAIFISFALLYWITMARVIRGQVLQLKNQEFVTAARALGASNGRIIRKHLLPNCIGSMIAAACLQIPSAIFLESFLSFLGVGINAPLTSLGSMCSDALGGMYTYTYRLIIPAVILLVLLLCFNLFGDGLRDALDPRLKK